MQAYYLEITTAGFYLYIALLVVAGIFDMWKFIIPNLLSIALILLFVLVAFSNPFGVNWWSHLGAALAFFVLGFALYAFKILGAGDVKLITAVSLWTGFENLLPLLFYIGIAGGVLAVLLIVVRRLLPSLLVFLKSPAKIKLPRILLPGEAVPYGVGIAAGGIFIGTTLPVLGYS